MLEDFKPTCIGKGKEKHASENQYHENRKEKQKSEHFKTEFWTEAVKEHAEVRRLSKDV